MLDFVEHRADVLVSTTIIESGLDIPRANTMFIDRADRFGLAQLYQLRGRMGRSRHRAYCYLHGAPGASGPRCPTRGSRPHPALLRSWAAASTWPARTWRSGAPGTCSGRARAGRSRPSGSRPTRGSSRRRWPSSRARQSCTRPTPSSTPPCRRSSPTPTSRTRASGWTSTAA